MDAEHACQAAAEGRRCITLVRPRNAHRVAQALLDEPRFCRETIDEATGERVLRDDAGTEHAQYEDAGVGFSALAPHPRGGGREVRAPIIPEYVLNGDDESVVSVLTAPDDADS